MRKWLVLAPYNDRVDRVARINDDGVTLDRLAIFTSGDGAEPEPGDLASALAEVGDEGGEIVLVSLDEARVLDIRVSTRIEVLSSGNLDALPEGP